MTNRLHAAFLACLVSILGGVPRLTAQPTQPIQVSTFTHYTYGPSGNGFWSTDFSIVSTSTEDVAAELDFFDSTGKPQDVPPSLGTGNKVVFTIPPLGTQEIELNGQDSSTLEDGFAQLQIFQGTATGGEIFTFDSADGAPLFSVPVELSGPGDTFISQATAGTGLALVNLDTTNALGVEVDINNADGSSAGSATLSVGPFNHASLNLNTLFTDIEPTFQGSVFVHASAPTLQALAIGAQASGSSFEAFAYPNVIFSSLASSFSGTFSVINGPDLGATGTLTISNIAPINTNTFSATVTSVFQGKTYTDNAVNFQSSIAPPDLPVVDFVDCRTDLLFPYVGGYNLSAQKQSNGNLSGVIFDCKPGGDIATWTGTPGS